jgi:brefeldin A-resistance guanine nucleotide exchange factor 1
MDKFESLLDLVKDDLARNLVSLLASERVATFSATLWISYLVFATQRQHLKYQMEIFLMRLIEVSLSVKISTKKYKKNTKNNGSPE